MRIFRPRVEHYSVPVRDAHPISIAMAGALGMLYGRGVDGRTGTVRYGYPAPGTQDKYGGYATPPQLFIGWNPARASAGAIRQGAESLPNTQAPAGYNSALLNLLATVGKR